MANSPSSIIIVDDDASMRQAVERLLNAAGWKAVSFATAEDALKHHGVLSAGGFILDIQLPGFSGFRLMEKLRELGATAPVIFVTGYDSPVVRELAESAGAIGYFAKPFVGRNLLESLVRHCAAA